jgi:hypothetical protein
MTLIKCYECGNRISNAATSCPSCGAPKGDSSTGDDVEDAVDRIMASGEINIGPKIARCPLCGEALKSMNAIEGIFRGGISGAAKRNRCVNCGHMP